MKNLFILLAKNKMTNNFFLKRKFKYILLAGFISIITVSGLFIWAGWSAVTFAHKQISSINTTIDSKKIEDQLNALPSLDYTQCWSQAQSLLSVELWLTQPISTNINKIIIACTKASPNICNDKNCEETLPNNKENLI